MAHGFIPPVTNRPTLQVEDRRLPYILLLSERKRSKDGKAVILLEIADIWILLERILPFFF
nr:hypothetical protein DA06_11550 [Georgenia sp. SUBG003]